MPKNLLTCTGRLRKKARACHFSIFMVYVPFHCSDDFFPFQRLSGREGKERKPWASPREGTTTTAFRNEQTVGRASMEKKRLVMILLSLPPRVVGLLFFTTCTKYNHTTSNLLHWKEHGHTTATATIDWTARSLQISCISLMHGLPCWPQMESFLEIRGNCFLLCLNKANICLNCTSLQARKLESNENLPLGRIPRRFAWRLDLRPFFPDLNRTAEASRWSHVWDNVPCTNTKRHLTPPLSNNSVELIWRSRRRYSCVLWQ